MSSTASSVGSRSSSEPEEAVDRESSSKLPERAQRPPPASNDPFSNIIGLDTHEDHASRRRNRDEQTMRDFLDDAYATASTEQSSEHRRQSIMAMDRKRRLTDSTHDGGRRRTNNGSFHDRQPSGTSIHGPLRLDGPSSPHGQIGQRRTNPNSLRGQEVIDLTGSSPEPRSRPLPPLPRRTSSTSSGRYIVPKWQPDSDVSECPICKRQFTFLFRRHHCRKCGRVVCNECSPHRITIPRQFIVQPPGPTSSRPVSMAQPVETVDMTGDNEEASAVPGFITSISSNSALGGGEKVRLCNPCVPDPQPNPLPSYNPPVLLSPGEIWRRDQGLPPLDPNRHATEAFRDLRHQRGRGMIFQPEGEVTDTARRARHGNREDLPPYGNFNYTVVPDDLRRQGRPPSYTNQQPNRPPGYNSLGQGSLSSLYTERAASSSGFHAPAHARFSSMDVPSRSSLHVSRPRVSSMFDINPRNSMEGASSSRPLLAGPPRSRLRESDICPICRRALPPKGVDGDEIARERHIMDCISSRDTTSSSAPSGRQALMQTPSRAPVQMLPFIATEKDCLGEDGSPQECSICMVEYDVGDQLARLECLCRFHRECIVEWFERKQECPLHKIV
jgi:FYVE zinc finger/Ring finger domain